MSADTLSDFLIARIADDELHAQAATPGPWRAAEMYPECYYVESEGGHRNIASESSSGDISEGDARHIARHDPARVLADCAAKRAVIEHVDMWGEDDMILRLLAQPYVSHAKFDQSWLVNV